ncbi:hypothetical protein JCM21900_004399 [Sporobolomyces salmonicolor]
MSGPASEYYPQSAMMSFTPINQIHQHLSGLHCYADDRSRAVSAHHFCSCAPGHETGKVRQCIIYDSDKADARLIGIEYVIHHDIFVSLPEEEKKYWHSHKYEVESGQLTLQSKSLVPTVAEDVAEQSAMMELHKANLRQGEHGSLSSDWPNSLVPSNLTIHTWAIDSSPSLPLGPPRLMMAFTADAQVSDSVISTVESVEQKSVAHKRELRAKYLDLDYEKAEGADQWEKTGKALELVAKEKDVTMPGREGATWKGKERLESVLGGNA